MTKNSDGLILDLDFSKPISGGKGVDRSGNGHDATLHGNVTRVADPTFGHCVALDGQSGSYLALEPMTIDYSGGFTIEAFVCYGAFKSWSPIIDFGNAAGQQNILLANASTTSNLTFQVYGAGSSLATVARDDVLEIDQWLHLVAAIGPDGTTMLYKNAQPLLEQPAGGAVPTSEGRSSLYIGKGNWSSDEYWQGKLGILRVYNRALTPQEIWQSYASSRLTTFRSTHPVDYRLYDADDNAVIYMADPQNQADQQLRLDVTNSSGANLYWGAVDPSATPSADHHHLALHFRKGVLSPDTLANGMLTGNDGWQLGIPLAADQPANMDALYLTYRGDDPTFAAGMTIPLTLQRFHADGRHGARGTQVQLLTNQLHRDPSQQDPPLRQTRVHHLNIVNHSGRQHIPLHVGFVDSNTVLNDGAAHPGEKLRLRFTNSSLTQSLTLTDPKLKFTLSVPTGDLSDEWALATAANVSAIKVALLNRDGSRIELGDATGDQANSLAWVIDQTTIAGAFAQLGPNQSFTVELDLANFSTQHPTGLAYLTVHYQGIPGYWEGQLVAPIEKTPLLFRGTTVGIGTLPTSNRLSVAGDIQHVGNTFQAEQQVKITGPTSKWVRFAQSISTYGGSSTGVFEIHWTRPSGEGRTVFAVNAIWNDWAQAQMTILESVGFREQQITKIRLVMRASQQWDRFYLEGYFEGDSADEYTIRFRKLSGVGWELITPSDGGVPDGYSANELPTGVLFATRTGQAHSAFVVQRNGNVGVGTAAPTTIAGASVLQIGSDKLTEVNSNGQLVIGKNNGSSTRKFRLGLDDNYHLSIGDFGHSNDNTYVPQVTIRWDNGNVGIGVPVPTEKLEVQGTVKATALKTASLTIGQYTFDEEAMKLLSFLVHGTLDVELYNLEQKEYMYAADYAPFDDERRRIFTWRRKEANGEGQRVSQGTWRLRFPH